MPLLKATPKSTTRLRAVFQLMKGRLQETLSAQCFGKAMSSLMLPLPGLRLRKIASAPVTSISSAGKEQDGKDIRGLEKIDIQVEEGVAKQPTIVKRTTLESRHSSFEPESVAGVWAPPIQGLTLLFGKLGMYINMKEDTGPMVKTLCLPYKIRC